MKLEDDEARDSTLDDILASMQEEADEAQAAPADSGGSADEAEPTSTSGEDSVEQVVAGAQDEQDAAGDELPISEMLLEDAQAPMEEPGAAADEFIDAPAADEFIDAPAGELTDEPLEPPAGASEDDGDSPVRDDEALQADETGDVDELILDMQSNEEVVERSALESILTEVQEDINGGSDGTDVQAQSSAERDKQSSPAGSVSGAAFAAKLPWLLVVVLSLNSAGVVAIAAAMLHSRGTETDRLEQLIMVLREDLQARRSMENEDTSRMLAEVDRAVELFDSGQSAEALPLLQNASRALPNRADLLWRAAVSAGKLERWQQSAELFEEFIERFPDHEACPDALMHIGDNFRRLGLFADARKWYYRVIGISGRLKEDQQLLVPAAYTQVADCYRLEAASLENAGAEQ